MFPEKSGVHDFLKEFNLHAAWIVNYKSELEKYRDALPNESAKWAQRRIDSVNWMLDSPDMLHALMAPFLNFHSL